MKTCARLYAMNSGITYIPRFMRCEMELHLIMGTTAKKLFDAKCPDGGRVCIHGEVLD